MSGEGVSKKQPDISRIVREVYQFAQSLPGETEEARARFLVALAYAYLEAVILVTRSAEHGAHGERTDKQG